MCRPVASDGHSVTWQERCYKSSVQNVVIAVAILSAALSAFGCAYGAPPGTYALAGISFGCFVEVAIVGCMAKRNKTAEGEDSKAL